MQTLTLLGATGSIGTQTVQVVCRHPDKVSIAALSAGRQADRLAELIQTLAHAQAQLPAIVCLQDDATAERFQQLLPAFKGCLVTGSQGLITLATWPAADAVVVGLVGAIGLPPSLAALQAGKRLLTANKETFVTGGHLVAPYLSQIVPMDSEHSAIFQCLREVNRSQVHELILTASGGPFRQTQLSDFSNIQPQQALCHPNWVMGPKVTIDSSTLMNKGLEVIEAHWLFGVPSEAIQVVIHPQSIVHSGVAFVDGSVLFQAGTPDMRVPIQVALSWPDRWDAPAVSCQLSVSQLGSLTFEAPDESRFPCLALARAALAGGPGSTTALNAADERAVASFLSGEFTFTDIPRFVSMVLDQFDYSGFTQQPDLDEIAAIAEWVQTLPLPAQIAY